MSASITRVPRPRGEIQPADLRRIKRALAGKESAQAELEAAITAATEHGASVRMLHEATGIAGTTIQAWTKRNRQP